MARVYNSTRLMLDPNFILSARRAADEREAAARESRRDIAKGINQTLGAIGGGIDYALRNMAKSDRRDIMANAPDIDDPEYKAAVERFVETGDLSGINAYRQIKEGRERMAREEAASEKELGIRKREAETMAQRTALEDAKIKEGLAEKARLDLQEAEIEYKNAITGADKERAKVNINRALLDLKSAGKDVSGYVLPDEKPSGDIGGTATEGAADDGKSIRAQINDFRARLNAGFNTKAEQAAFIAEVQAKREGAKGAEVDEFVKLIDDARKVKPEEKKAEEKKSAQKKKADLYAEKSKSAAEFFVWFNGLNEKDQADYEAAFKEVYGGK